MLLLSSLFKKSLYSYNSKSLHKTKVNTVIPSYTPSFISICSLVSSSSSSSLSLYQSNLHSFSSRNRQTFFHILTNSFSSSSSIQNTSKPQNKKSQLWRIYNVDVCIENDPSEDSILTHTKLVDSIIHTLHIKASTIAWRPTADRIKIIEKSLDERRKKFGQSLWVYTVEIDIPSTVVRQIGLKEQIGKCEKVDVSISSPLSLVVQATKVANTTSTSVRASLIPPATQATGTKVYTSRQPRAVISGAGEELSS